MFYMGRSDSELDYGALAKVMLAFMAAKHHVNQCTTVNQIDFTAPSMYDMIVPTPAAPWFTVEPEPHRVIVGTPPVRSERT